MRRILGLLKPHWTWATGFLLSVILVSILDAFFTYLSKQIVDEGILARDVAVLRRILVQYGLLTLLQAAGIFGFIYLVGVIGERIRYDLRQRMFNHLQMLSLSYFSRTPVGWIMARVTNDTERVADLVTWGLLDATWGAVNILTALSFMAVINWQLTLFVLVLVPILLIVAVQFQKRILFQFRQVRKINSRITASFNETITGVRVIKALNREDQNLREFSGLTGSMYKAGYRAAWLSALFLPSVQIISAFALGGIIWYSGYQVSASTMTIGSIQAFVSYITFMLWPIQDMARVFAELQHTIASAERIFSLVDAKPEIQDKPGALDPGTLQGISVSNMSPSGMKTSSR